MHSKRKTVLSKVLGELTQHKDFREWWVSDEIKVPYFNNQKLTFTFHDFTPEQDPAFIDEADIAIKNFLTLNLNDRKAISTLIYQNCLDFLEAVGYDETDEPLWAIKDDDEIWKYVYPANIYVERRLYKDKEIYIKIACECEWEQEHGLQLVLRQGKKLTRVSAQDGHLTDADAYDKPDEQDKLLSNFNKED
jgi:hypothetical protein